MRAILIDTPNKQIIDVEWNGDYKSIYPLIKADLFTTVMLNNDTQDVVFVDDEGLINGNPHGWFTINGYPQPLRGYGLVLGTGPEGKSIEPRTTTEELRTKISFPEDSELKDPEEYADVQVMSFNTAEEMIAAMGLGARR
mgnify:CR=1 FL=1